ncbi:MAG: DUF423 domain-containing protein [Salibacteraceae bacterium]
MIKQHTKALPTTVMATFVDQFNTMKNKPFHLLFGSFFTLTAVILGAFGAHLLKELLTPEQLNSFETGVRYQMYHGLILVMIALKGHSFHLQYERLITTLFGIGIVFFSWSIYLLNLQELLGFSASWLGPITPIGGLLLITAWLLIFIDAVKLITIKKA